jgi:hypothetical protein
MQNDWRQIDIRWLAVIASLAVSVSTLLFQGEPNADAYTYVRTAEIFLSDGVVAAYQHYFWATYSILIAAVSWFGIDLFSAGLLVNSFFYALLVFAFISIIREIDDSRPLLLIAAIILLVYPQLNEYRNSIIRDIGYWALSVFALWQYLLFTRTQLTKHALCYCGSLLFAAAFRVEALAYLILTPFSLLLDIRFEPKIRKKLLLKLGGILLTTAIFMSLCLALMGLNIANLFIEFISVYQPFIEAKFTLPEEERALLGSLLFGDHATLYSREYIELFLLVGLAAILLANLFNAIGGPYLTVLLLGYFSKKRMSLERHITTPVIFYILINALILTAFLIITRFLSSRYAMLLCIMLVVFVPLIIQHFYSAIKEPSRRKAQLAFAIFLSYCAIDSYYSFGEEKPYITDSIEWIRENTDTSAKLLTNNHSIAYFSGKVSEYDQVQRNLTEEAIFATGVGDTIAAELTFETKQTLEKSSVSRKIEFLTAFPNEKNQRIVLYKRVNL